MSKKMLINVIHPEEARVAIVEDGRLVELDIETAGKEQTRGNVYKGVVVRVEPGLQAAFVEIGQKKLGFLQMGEIQPSFWQWRDDLSDEQRNRRPRIQDILRRGQELIVQVEKGEREGKGAALTTYLSLPGRYMVLMPGSDSTGISRKVEVEAERKKLREIMAEIEIPEGYGYIIRTEALGKRKSELAKDLQYLIRLFESIREKADQSGAPSLIYQESDLVIRTIRDYFTADIDEVLVDSKDVYKQARAFFKEIMPKYEKWVKLHQEKRPIFSKYQLEEQIDLIYEKKVPLKSGGSIVIDPTEALVSIDVNSGKSTGERGVEDTAFKTNMEAAEEIARQLRLRDLGGLIVIDFIDMRDRKHQTEVEKTLKNALKADKARVSVGKISQFGLLEMSRQRIKQTINEGSYLECPHCSGHGRVKSVETMALSFLRKVHAAAAKGTVAEVRGGLPLDVAYYLLNRKKRELAQIENEHDIEITVKGKPSFTMNQIEVEMIRKEKEHPPEKETELAAAELEPESGAEKEVAENMAGTPESLETKAKKKRRRHKKKPKITLETDEETLPAEAQSPIAEPAPSEAPMAAGDMLPPEEAAPPATEEASADATETGLAPEPVESEAAEAETDQESHVKKKRRRRRKRTTKPLAQEEPADITAPVAEAAPVTEPEPIPMGGEEAAPAEEPAEAKPKRKRKPRKKAAAEVEVMAEQTPEPATTTPEVPAPVEEAVLTGEAAEEEGKKAKPKRTGRPRKKKEPATEPSNEP